MILIILAAGAMTAAIGLGATALIHILRARPWTAPRAAVVLALVALDFALLAVVLGAFGAIQTAATR